MHALVTDERKLTRGLMRQIIGSIQCNDLSTPMKLLITERLKLNAVKSNAKQHSIYRDLLFLTFVALGRENINHSKDLMVLISITFLSFIYLFIAAFDREYRRAFESMTPKDQLGLSAIDKPPSIGAVLCRRFFKELDLRLQTTNSLITNNNSTVSK